MIFWLIVAFVAGTTIGVLVTALCAVSGRADESAEQMHRKKFDHDAWMP